MLVHVILSLMELGILYILPCAKVTSPNEFVGAVFHPLVESGPPDMLPYGILANPLLGGTCTCSYHRSVVTLKVVLSAI